MKCLLLLTFEKRLDVSDAAAIDTDGLIAREMVPCLFAPSGADADATAYRAVAVHLEQSADPEDALLHMPQAATALTVVSQRAGTDPNRVGV